MNDRPAPPKLHIEPLPLARLRPHPRNARRRSKSKARQTARSVGASGYANPALDGSGPEILAGQGPLGPARLALNGARDQGPLASELAGLAGAPFDVCAVAVERVEFGGMLRATPAGGWAGALIARGVAGRAGRMLGVNPRRCGGGRTGGPGNGGR